MWVPRYGGLFVAGAFPALGCGAVAGAQGGGFALALTLIVLVLTIAATVNTVFFLWEKRLLARRAR